MPETGALPVGRTPDDEGVCRGVSRSIANCASRASVVIDNHSDGSLFELTIVALRRWRSTTNS